MNSLKKISILLVVSLFTLTGRSQENYLINISVEEGLPQSEVNSIFQDSRGYLWLGTSSGIGQYNGRNFKVFDQSNGLTGDIITAIGEDNSGTIYVGSTWGGLSVYDGVKWSSIRLADGLLSDDVSDIITNDKSLFALTGAGIHRIENGKIQISQKLEPYKAYRQLLIHDRKLIISTDKGILSYNSDELKTPVAALESYEIRSMSPAKKGGYYLATQLGIVHITEDTIINPDFERLLKSAGVDTKKPCDHVFEDKDGALWITYADEGVLKIWNSNKTTFYSSSERFKGVRINEVFQDNEGIIWITTFGRGLYKLMSKPLEKFGLGGFTEGSIFGITQDSLHNFYFLDIRKGIIKYDGNQHSIILSTGTSGASRFLSMAFTPDNTLLVGTDKGLIKYKNGTIQWLREQDGLPGSVIRSICVEDDGSYYLGFVGKGLVHVKGNEIIPIATKELENQSVHVIYKSTRGVLYFGTGTGLFKYDGNILRNYGTRHGLCNSYVGNITEDNYGGIWVSTDNCIGRFYNEKFEVYNRNNGLASNVFYLLQRDQKGNIWVGSNNGIDCISPDKDGKPETIKHYGKEEGFLGIECNARASHMDHQGNLWFASIDGPYVYRGNLDVTNEKPPVLHLRNVKVFFDENITLSYMKGVLNWFGLPENLELPAYHNHLTFDVDAINFTAPGEIKYSYKLEGADRNFTPPLSTSSVTYSNLSPGTYYFNVIAYNSDGVQSENLRYGPIVILESEEESGIPFIIWVIIAILGTGCIYALGYFIITREKRMLKMRKILESKVKSRTAEIERQNQEKEVMLKEIHHRVKNNLQIINSLMSLQVENVHDDNIKEIFREAKNRISSMALIHEKIYENRRMVNVKMKDYIKELVHKLLDSYNIGDNIRLHTNIGEDVTLNMNQIVPVGLILNEIISNSLKYGFPDHRRGAIIVEMVSTGEGFYKLTAGDDGIGLPETFVVDKDKSLGMELIHLLADQLGASVEIDRVSGLRYILRMKRESL